MTADRLRDAEELLEWSRTVEEHRLPFAEWQRWWLRREEALYTAYAAKTEPVAC